LVFDNVRLRPGSRAGEVDKGFYSVMKNLQTERIALGGHGGWVIAQRAIAT